MKKLLLMFICLTLAASVSAAPYWGTSCKATPIETLTSGVILQTLNCSKGSNLMIVHIIKADTKKVNLIPIGLKNPKDRQLKSLMDISFDSFNSKIVAGINGGFFNMVSKGYKDNICRNKTHLNYGEGDSYLLINKKDWAKNCEPRPVVAFKTGVAPMIIPYLNPDESLSSGISNAVGGGPTLVINKKIEIDRDSSKYDWLDSKVARTAIGVKEGRYVYLVTVEKASTSPVDGGATIEELARFMLEGLDVDDAMNLDGGNSSTMCKGKNCRFLVTPSDEGQMREIHDGIFIVEK